MNERQRDLFLWQWSHRRRVGFARVALRGALIGAAGGLVFALVLGSDLGGNGARDTAWMLRTMRDFGLLLGMSIPAFAWIGYLGASRVFSANEQMYQAILQQGARVPAQKPVLTTADRGPAIAVAVAATLIAALILAAIIFLG